MVRRPGWQLSLFPAVPLLASSLSAAQNYSTRPVRWIVWILAGATADIITPLGAQKLGEA